MRCLVAALLVLLIAPVLAADTGRGRWVVQELRVNDRPHSGSIWLDGPLTRGARATGEGELSIFAVMVVPGRHYTLSLACADFRGPFRMALYDRWPLAPQAQRLDLPMGPIVRTRSKGVEYRWQVGIAPQSRGTTLYMVLERPRAAPLCGAPIALGVIDPPVRPQDTLDHGITWLSGPDQFVVAPDPSQLAYAVVRSDPVSVPAAGPAMTSLPIPGDLVRNGAFRDGLNHWQPHRDLQVSNDIQTVSLHADGLRIRSTDSKQREGMMQVLDAKVSGIRSLLLRADVRVDRQAQAGTGPDGRSAPIAIAVCYEDVAGREHCGKQGYWRGFYGIAPAENEAAANGQKVPQGQWYRYQADLMQLDPKPDVIRSISLEGAGWPERDGWVRNVHLLKREE